MGRLIIKKQKEIIYKGTCDNCGMEVVVSEAQSICVLYGSERDFWSEGVHDAQCWGCDRLLHLKEDKE